MIHRYKFNGTHIVIDAGSGSVHVTDALAYDVIGMVERGVPPEEIMALADNAADIEELMRDIETLRESGLLFAPDVTELVEPNDGGEIKALCLHAAHACNLECDYCFASQGSYHGVTPRDYSRAGTPKDALSPHAAAPARGPRLMSFDTAKRAIDFLAENSGSRVNLEVDFFGGEPLLNLDVIKQTVAYARSLEKKHHKHFRFTLTTNGVLLTDNVTEFANAEIENVVLSLDGRREVHDARRKTLSGGGSYGDIVPKFQRFIEKRGGRGWYIRGTYTSANTDFYGDILHIADLGFSEIAMEPAVLPRGHALALGESDLPRLFSQYENLAVEMAKRESEGRGFSFYHYTLDLENGPCAVKRVRGCGAGTEYFAVTPDGTLYPCHQLAGEENFIAGDVYTGVKPGFAFRRADVNEREKCRGCWAKLWCAGGCAANAYRDTGDVDGVHAFGCELFKKRLECAIWLVSEARSERAGE